jgi:hypothetical protein
MVEGLFPQMWANCGIFVEQSQSFHRFSARWKNCCKRGNLSTKKLSLQTVEQVNGGGRWTNFLTFRNRLILRNLQMLNNLKLKILLRNAGELWSNIFADDITR